MIIVDFSQIAMGNAIAHLYRELKDPTPDAAGAIRHLALSSLASINKKFKKQYGELVITCDAPPYWRRDVYAGYKAGRKKSRDSSPVDWKFIHETCAALKQELKDFFPYKIIDVPTAEADDVMACIAKASNEDDRLLVKEGLFESTQRVLIVSEDNDMNQLLKYSNVDHYSVRKKAFFTDRSTLVMDMMRKICSGETSDSIPNVRTTVMVEGVRQKAVRENFATDIIENFDSQPKDIKANYERNRKLIDFDCIPDTIYKQTVEQYLTQVPTGSRSKISGYLMKQGLVRLLENVNDF